MGNFTENVDTFGEEIVNASINNTRYSLDNLTPVEFRMWVNYCKTFPNFHPSHFEGKELNFVKTGKWEE